MTRSGKSRARQAAQRPAASAGFAGGWRRTAASLVVGVVALWPLCHRGLVAWQGIHPWKLGGFAMYTTYATTHVALFEPRRTGLALVDERTLPPEAQRALQDFRGERGALGRLKSPDELARRIFDGRPGMDELVVVIQRQWLDPSSARIVSEKEIVPYERSSGGG